MTVTDFGRRAPSPSRRLHIHTHTHRIELEGDEGEVKDRLSGSGHVALSVT